MWRRLVGVIRRKKLDGELEAELAHHFDALVDEHEAQGLTRDNARIAARRDMGGLTHVRETYRDQLGVPFLESLWRDVRYALRACGRNPGFSAVVVITLALGIGANTAMFSVVNAVILRPLPFAEPSRIMRVWHTPPPEQFGGRPIFAVSPANYLDWRAQSDVFEHMAIYTLAARTLTGRGTPELVGASVVSADFFRVLGVQPIRGRTFTAGEDEPGASNVVIISEGLWHSRLGGDPSAIGRSLMLDGQPHTIVGIIHPLAFQAIAEIWVPLVWTDTERRVRAAHDYLVIARLKAEVKVQQAQAEMTTISKRLEQQYPGDNKGWGARVLPLHDDLLGDVIGDVRTPLFVLLGAVAFVLLIACANVANLLLAKGLARGKEIAVRAALGASRTRILQQLLIETVILALVGATVGLVVAHVGAVTITNSIGEYLPRSEAINIDRRVLTFTGVIAVCTGLLAGLMPAWRLAGIKLNETLQQGLGRAGSERGGRRVRELLVVSEVALAIVLLVGAGLLIRTLGQLRAVDLGIDPRNVLTMPIVIPETLYPRSLQQSQFFERVLSQVHALPGISSAAVVSALPLEGGSTQAVAIEGRPPVPLSEQPEVAVRMCSPGYLATMGMRLVSGRDFTDADQADRPNAVLISESMARRFWPNANPLGKRLTLGLMSNAPREVVGIVNDVKLLGLGTREPVAAVYVPDAQRPASLRFLVVRATIPPKRMTQAVINALHTVDPDRPVRRVLTMDEVIETSLTSQRFVMWLLTAFAGLALVMAAAGIYNVLVYTVRQRVREIGIRMALGASPTGVLRMVIEEGMMPALIGLVIGIGGAALLGNVLKTLLFDVTPRDGMTFITVSLFVIVVSLLASAVPGYRATRVDPLHALRTE